MKVLKSMNNQQHWTQVLCGPYGARTPNTSLQKGSFTIHPPSSMYLAYLLAGLVSLYLIRKVTSFRECLRSVRCVSVTRWPIATLKNSVRYLSGYRYVFSPFSLVGFFCPQIPYFCGSLDLHFNEKHTRVVHRFSVWVELTQISSAFAKAGWDVISLVRSELRGYQLIKTFKRSTHSLRQL